MLLQTYLNAKEYLLLNGLTVKTDQATKTPQDAIIYQLPSSNTSARRSTRECDITHTTNTHFSQRGRPSSQVLSYFIAKDTTEERKQGTLGTSISDQPMNLCLPLDDKGLSPPV